MNSSAFSDLHSRAKPTLHGAHLMQTSQGQVVRGKQMENLKVGRKQRQQPETQSKGWSHTSIISAGLINMISVIVGDCCYVNKSPLSSQCWSAGSTNWSFC